MRLDTGSVWAGSVRGLPDPRPTDLSGGQITCRSASYKCAGDNKVWNEQDGSEIGALRRDLRGALLGQIDLEERGKASIRALAVRVERLEWLLDWLKQQVARDIRVVIESGCRSRHTCNFRGGRKT